MSDTRSVDDLLMGGGGAPAAKFPTVGTTWKGTITDKTMSQQTDMVTGKPKTYDDGNPMMQVVLTIQTDQRDATIEGDDGTRRLFIKGAMLAAVKKAIKDADAPTAEVGGTIAIKYTHDGEGKPGLNPPKQYIAQYAAPVAAVSNDDLLG